MDTLEEVCKNCTQQICWICADVGYMNVPEISESCMVGKPSSGRNLICSGVVLYAHNESRHAGSIDRVSQGYGKAVIV